MDLQQFGDDWWAAAGVAMPSRSLLQAVSARRRRISRNRLCYRPDPSLPHLPVRHSSSRMALSEYDRESKNKTTLRPADEFVLKTTVNQVTPPLDWKLLIDRDRGSGTIPPTLTRRPTRGTRIDEGRRVMQETCDLPRSIMPWGGRG
eukprot:327322-Hanusia_phi.AAC.2